MPSDSSSQPPKSTGHRGSNPPLDSTHPSSSQNSSDLAQPSSFYYGNLSESGSDESLSGLDALTSGFHYGNHTNSSPNLPRLVSGSDFHFANSTGSTSSPSLPDLNGPASRSDFRFANRIDHSSSNRNLSNPIRRVSNPAVSRPSPANHQIRRSDAKVRNIDIQDLRAAARDSAQARQATARGNAQLQQRVKLPSDASSADREDGFSCPVCFDQKEQIVGSGRRLMSTLCGHVFCNECIADAQKRHERCPTCQRPLGPADIHPIFI